MPLSPQAQVPPKHGSRMLAVSWQFDRAEACGPRSLAYSPHAKPALAPCLCRQAKSRQWSAPLASSTGATEARIFCPTPSSTPVTWKWGVHAFSHAWGGNLGAKPELVLVWVRWCHPSWCTGWENKKMSPNKAVGDSLVNIPSSHWRAAAPTILWKGRRHSPEPKQLRLDKKP